MHTVSFRKYRLDVHFRIHEIDSCFCNRVCGIFSLVSYVNYWLLSISLTPESGGFEPFRDTTHVFFMIPSFKIDHGEITELDSMNISTLQGVSTSYVIYCQLQSFKGASFHHASYDCL